MVIVILIGCSHELGLPGNNEYGLVMRNRS